MKKTVSICFKLPEDIADRLEKLARERGISKSDLLRTIVTLWVSGN